MRSRARAPCAVHRAHTQQNSNATVTSNRQYETNGGAAVAQWILVLDDYGFLKCALRVIRCGGAAAPIMALMMVYRVRRIVLIAVARTLE